jgi:hypothetical protein
VEDSAEDPFHVGVDRRFVQLVGELGHRASGILPDAGLSTEGFGRAGQHPVVVASHLAGEAVEVGGPPIIPEAGPALAHP